MERNDNSDYLGTSPDNGETKRAWQNNPDLDNHNTDEDYVKPTLEEGEDEQKLSWNKLDSESNRAYTLFCHFRDSGYHRRKTETARAFNVSVAYLNQLRVKYDWDQRIEDYDLYQDNKRQERIANAREIIDTNFINANVMLSEHISKAMVHAKPRDVKELIMMQRELREGMGVMYNTHKEEQDTKIDKNDIESFDLQLNVVLSENNKNKQEQEFLEEKTNNDSDESD